MRIIKYVISIIVIAILFVASFWGSYSYFNKGTFEFDVEKLAVFNDDTDCFFLREAPSDIIFRIELSEGEDEVSYFMTDSQGNTVDSKCEKVSSRIYNIVSPPEGYVEGEQYTLTLGDNVSFTDINIKEARILVFTIKRENIEEYKFTENVIETEKEIAEIEEGLIFLNGIEAEVGNIVFGKDKNGEYIVYKIIQKNSDGTAKVVIPAIDEIYEKLDVYGEYEFDIDQIVDNPELDIEIADNVKKSDFFTDLVITAYAAEEIEIDGFDKTKISVSKTKDEANNAIEIGIVITLDAGEKGLFGIEELKNHSVCLSLKQKVGFRLNANIKNITNWDVAGTVASKTSWNVEIERKIFEVDKEKELEELFTDKSFDDYYKFKEYQNNIKKIVGKLDQITADVNGGELKLFDWNVPIPSIPGLYFDAEIRLFFDFSVAANISLGQENSAVYTVGVCLINKEFNAYSNTYKSGDDVSLSLRGKLNLKAGIKLAVMAKLICKEVAYVELEPQLGLYCDVFATIPILGADNILEKMMIYSYFEPGVYFKADLKASLNLLVDKINYTDELVEMKYPIEKWKIGNDKIAMGLIINGTTVRAIDNKVKIPEIFFEYYDVKSGINGSQRVSFDDIKFISSEGNKLEVNGDCLILPAATSSESCYVTATYLHTDGKTYSAVFRILISGSMIEGRVSAYQENLETAALEGAKVTIYSVDNNGTPIGTVETDSNGKFAFNVSKGEYNVVISADGYQTLKSIQKVEEDEIKYAEHILLIDNAETGTGRASGTLTDAINGKGISEAEIKIRTDWNNKTGSYIDGVEFKTDYSGRYSIENIPVGYYTLEASKEGYVTGYTNIIVLSSNPKTDFDFTITPLLSGDEMRIVLTWGDTPRDLDSHLIGEKPDNTSFDVYYGAKRYYFDSIEMANLDVDDTTSYGPETVTILKNVYGVYTYAVHDYSNKNSSGSTALSLSGAVVRVFVGSKQIGEYHVPPDQVGTYWSVFQISGSGKIMPINSISNIKPAV